MNSIFGFLPFCYLNYFGRLPQTNRHALNFIRSTPSSTATPEKLANTLSQDNKKAANGSSNSVAPQHARKRPMLALPFIKAKNASVCVSEAYLEFPEDLIGNKWRGRGLVLLHLAVVCYMFYSLALVCERYFMPSLEEFAQRLELSEDVAGATLMSAGSSAPELFTAILGVFVAKGDVGTGAIVGSAGKSKALCLKWQSLTAVKINTRSPLPTSCVQCSIYSS